MPDYAPVFLPGLTMTFQAAANLSGGDPVEVAGSGTVQKCTAGPGGLGSQKYIGVANHDATAGLNVTVTAANPVHEGAADGAVIAGDMVMASAKPGCQVTAAPDTASVPSAADVNTARAIIGVALITAADNGTVRWMQR